MIYYGQSSRCAPPTGETLSRKHPSLLRTRIGGCTRQLTCISHHPKVEARDEKAVFRVS